MDGISLSSDSCCENRDLVNDGRVPFFMCEILEDCDVCSMKLGGKVFDDCFLNVGLDHLFIL